MQLKPIAAILVLSLVVASLSVAGCTSSIISSPTPTAEPTWKPIVRTPTDTPTAAPTAVPTVTPTGTPTGTPTRTPSPIGTDSYSSALDQAFNKNYVLTVPFHKTTLNGKVAYEGTAIQTGTTLVIRVYPMSSYTDATAFRETLIAKYKSEGWTVLKTTTDEWQGIYGSRVVGISAAANPAGTPVTTEILGNQ